MITVRFPSGFFVTYNSASWAVRKDAFTDLYTRKDGDWVAQVNHASGAIIEVVPPCSVGTSLHSEALKVVANGVRSFTSYSEMLLLARLKSELQSFNARSRCWSSKP